MEAGRRVLVLSALLTLAACGPNAKTTAIGAAPGADAVVSGDAQSAPVLHTYGSGEVTLEHRGISLYNVDIDALLQKAKALIANSDRQFRLAFTLDPLIFGGPTTYSYIIDEYRNLMPYFFRSAEFNDPAVSLPVAAHTLIDQSEFGGESVVIFNKSSLRNVELFEVDYRKNLTEELPRKAVVLTFRYRQMITSSSSMTTDTEVIRQVNLLFVGPQRAATVHEMLDVNADTFVSASMKYFRSMSWGQDSMLTDELTLDFGPNAEDAKKQFTVGDSWKPSWHDNFPAALTIGVQ